MRSSFSWSESRRQHITCGAREIGSARETLSLIPASHCLQLGRTPAGRDSQRSTLLGKIRPRRPASPTRTRKEAPGGSSMSQITLKVNGRSHTVDVDPATPLLYILRNDLDLHGPHFGCGLGQCGACTVLIGGNA